MTGKFEDLKRRNGQCEAPPLFILRYILSVTTKSKKISKLVALGSERCKNNRLMIRLSIKRTTTCFLLSLGMATAVYGQVDVGTGSSKVTYATLKEAVENATTGKTIYLTQDITETGSISFTGKTLTLNLKGYKLTLNGENDKEVANFIVGSGATLKIQGGLSATWSVDENNNYKVTYQDKNGKDQGTLQLDGTVFAKEGGYVDVVSGNIVSTKGVALYAMGDQTGASSIGSKIFVEDGYIKSQEFAVTAQGNGATVIIGQKSSKKTGPVLEALDNAVVAGNGTYTDTKKLGGTDITIYSATLIGRIQSPGYVACGIYHPQQGKLSIGYNAKIYALGGCGILMRGGTMTMGGSASIVATGDKALTGKVGDSRVVVGTSGIVYDYDCGYYDSKNVNISVNGYEATPISVKSSADAVSVVNESGADVSGKVILKNGLFSSDVSKYVDTANGYTCEKEGDMYHVANYVAQIGDVKWNNLRDAVANAKDGETVVVLKDYTALSYQLVPTHNVTLDLNGKYVKCHSVKVSGTASKLTIKDGAAAMKSARRAAAAPGSITTGLTGGVLEGVGSDGYTVLVEKGGEATLESGTVVNTYTKANTATTNVVFRAEGDNTQTTDVKSTVNINGGSVKTVGTPVFVAYKGATVNVNGGELEGSGLAVIAGNGTAGMGGTTVNVAGGTLKAGVPSDGASCGIYNPQDGVVNISGGKIISEQGPGVLMRSGKLNMTGGEVEANGAADYTGTVGDANIQVATSGVIFDRDANYPAAANTEITISGDSKVSGAKAAVALMNENNHADAENAIEIKGGEFSGDVESIAPYVDEGSLAKDENGKVTVEAGHYAAKVGDVKYESFDEALTAATTGSTVTVLSDIDTPTKDYAVENKTLTIDINGKNIKANHINANAGANLTLKDGTATTAPVVDEDNRTVVYNAGTVTLTSAMSANGGGKLTIESGKYVTSSKYALLGANGDKTGATEIASEVTVNGGYLQSQEFTVSPQGKGAIANVCGGVMVALDNAVVGGNGTNKDGDKRGGTTINIAGGTMIGHIKSAGYAACGVYHPQEGVLNISGGKIIAINGCGVLMRGGKLNQTGGEVIATGDATAVGKVGDSRVVVGTSGIIFDRDANYYDASNTTVKVSGEAKVSGSKAAIEVIDTKSTGADDAITVTGGTFSSDVSDFCENGSTAAPNADGTYGIVSGDIILAYKDKSQTMSASDNALEFNTADLSKFVVNADMTGVNVKMTHNFTTTNWESFFAPFSITITDEMLQKFEFAEIFDTELGTDGVSTTLEFRKLAAGSVIEANTPFIVKALATGEATLDVANADIKKQTSTVYECSTLKQQFTFVGALERTTLKDKYGYYLSKTQQSFRPVESSEVTIAPMKFYMTIQNKSDQSYVYPSTTSEAKTFVFRVIGDETNGINDVNADKKQGETKVYSLQGTYLGNSLRNLPAGVYIINGKKSVIK